MMSPASPRQQRIEREKKYRMVTRLAFLFILLGFLVCIGYAVYSWASSEITNLLLQYEPATIGRVEEVFPVKGIVLRKEMVVEAPAAGRFENVVLDRQRVRQGTLVGRLCSDDGSYRDVRSPESGMIVFTTDGLEDVFNREDLMDEKSFSYSSSPRSSVGEEVSAGASLFKIVDNLVPIRVLLTFKLEAFSDPWQVGQEVVLLLKGKQYKGRVTDLKGEGEMGFALLTLPPDDSLLETRFADFKIVVRAEEGVTVPVDSLVSKAGEKGVYVLDGDQANFYPVKVVCQNGKRAVVEGIKVGQLVVSSPERIKLMR